MENKTKKAIRSSKAQINHLCQYMLKNPSFAAGDYRSPLGSNQNNREWERLKIALDELGPVRSVDQWKISWRDQKRKARAEGGALQKAKDATGNVVPIPELSETSALVLGAIGQEMAVGFGPEESRLSTSESGTVDPEPRPPTSQCQAQPELAQTIQRHPQRTAPARRRARRTLPPEQFLNAQSDLNNLIKELITEVRHSNQLREKHLEFLQNQHEKH